MKIATALLALSLSKMTFGFFDLPKNKPQLGNRALICAAIDWADDHSHADPGKIRSLCNQVRSFYQRNSRGLMDIKVQSLVFKTALNNNKANFDKVKAAVKAAHPNADMYALVVGLKLGASHAGQGTAFLRGFLYRDAQHEVGHLLGLGHAGRYEWEKGKPVLYAYKDGESVMGRFPSSTLTGPQYRWDGWLPPSEVAVYNPTLVGKEFEVKRITDTKTQKLSLVGVPTEYWFGANPSQPAPVPHRDAYLSFSDKCDACLSLHLSLGGGSQKVQMIGREYYDTDFTGMHVKVSKADKLSIKFTIDFEAKPKSFVPEVAITETP